MMLSLSIIVSLLISFEFTLSDDLSISVAFSLCNCFSSDFFCNCFSLLIFRFLLLLLSEVVSLLISIEIVSLCNLISINIMFFGFVF